MITKRTVLLFTALCIFMGLNAQNNILTCPGQPVTVECSVDSAMWLLASQGQVFPLDSTFQGATFSVNLVTLTDSVLAAGLDSLWAQSLAVELSLIHI